MIRSESSKFKRPLYILYPGDYHAIDDDGVFGTVTGSCICVCLFDHTKNLGGMGLFIIPGGLGTAGIYADDIARTGILNMEYLIGEIVKLGGDRRLLRAKIFGAAYIANQSDMDLTENSIRFINEYFTLENIRVERSDLGGEFRRRLYFMPHDGKVYRQILKNNEESSEFHKLEQEYVDSEFRKKERKGRVVLFE